MEYLVRNFWKEDDGNTTIDWLVLTAGLVLLGAASVTYLTADTATVADNASPATQIETRESGV